MQDAQAQGSTEPPPRMYPTETISIPGGGPTPVRGQRWNWKIMLNLHRDGRGEGGGPRTMAVFLG